MSVIRIISTNIVMLYLLCFAIRENATSGFFHDICANKRHDTKPEKIIISSDAGADDALAIMLLLGFEAKCKEIKILAIISEYGNTGVQNTTKNILKILKMANATKRIPVYIGADKPLNVTGKYKNPCYFGCDGLGDLNYPDITGINAKPKKGFKALVDIVKEYPGEITVFTLGPLTTIAAAIGLEPNFLNLIKQHVMMGSNITGNMTEFNFQTDPKADKMVFNTKLRTRPSIVIPVDTVISCAFKQEERTCLYDRVKNSVTDFLNETEIKQLEGDDNWYPADGWAAAIFIQPNIITQSCEVNLTPLDVKGEPQGSPMINYTSTKRNAIIITGLDKAAFKHIFITLLNHFHTAQEDFKSISQPSRSHTAQKNCSNISQSCCTVNVPCVHMCRKTHFDKSTVTFWLQDIFSEDSSTRKPRISLFCS